MAKASGPRRFPAGRARPPGVWAASVSILMSSSRASSGRLRLAAGSANDGSDAVDRLGVGGEQAVAFLGREVGRDRVEGGIEGVERAVDSLNREIAGEHRPAGAEDVDALQHDRSDAVGRPGAVGDAEAGNLDRDL